MSKCRNEKRWRGQYVVSSEHMSACLTTLPSLATFAGLSLARAYFT